MLELPVGTLTRGYLGLLSRRLVKYLIKNLTWVLDLTLPFILIIAAMGLP